MPAVCPDHNSQYNKWYQCPDCVREARKRYENTEKGKIYKSRKDERYRGTTKGKQRRVQQQKRYSLTPKGKLCILARKVVNQAIRSGVLVKQPCVVCNNPKTEAHHAWGYSEENKLRVVFLCKEHHYQADHDPVFNEKLKSDFLPCA